MIVFSSNRSRKACTLPPPVPDIERVDNLKILGVNISHTLSVEAHVSNVCQTATHSMYAVKLLQSYRMDTLSVYSVFQALILSRLTYAFPAWGGFCNANEISQLQSVLNKGIKWGFYSKSAPSFTEIVNKREADLFNKIIQNTNHVLHHLLPPVRAQPYNLRPRAHNRTLPCKKGHLIDKNFLIGMLYN